MKHFSDQLTIAATFIATILLGYATSVIAQPPVPADEIFQEKSAKPAPTPEELKQGSHRSLVLTRSQPVIQCIGLIRDAIERKDYLAAIPLMERVLSEPNSFVPFDATTEVAAHEEVRRFASKIPSDLRKRLDDQRMAVALRQWERIRTAPQEDLIAFLHQYLDLPIAIEAWWRLGTSERDHGRDRIAAAAFMKIADHPQATNLQRVIALITAYETPNADHSLIRDRIANLDPQLKLQIGDRSLHLGQWLKEHPIERISGSSVAGAPLADTIRSRLKGPVVLPVWKQQFNFTQLALVTAQEQRQRAIGVKPVPLTRPMIIGDRVIVRNLDAIYAYNASNGAAQWFWGNTEYRDLESLGIFDRIVNQSLVVDWIQRRTQADSIFGRMSTDGHRLFVIQEPDRMREFGHDRQTLRAGFRSGPRFNKLAAYKLDDGTPEWEIGGGSSAYVGDFFLGSPFVLDETLYVVVQRETEVLLHAIQPEDGSRIWSKTLGDVLLPVAEDLQRSRVACPITYKNGLLLVSTGAGAVVAVDPVLRSLVWGYRYPARTISAGDLLQGQNPADIQQVQETWWDNWREPYLQSTDLAANSSNASTPSGATSSGRSMLIFASPETDLIHAVRLPGGEAAWREPRSGGLMIAGIVENRLIVVEGDFIRAHELDTGRVVWRTATAEVSGSVTLTGEMLVVPLLSGGTMLLDARTGQTIADSANSESPLGTLLETDQGWIACSRQSLILLPRLGDIRKQVSQELQTTPDNESLRMRAAFLDLQAGDFEAARKSLEGLQSTPARELRRQALIDALKDFGPQHSTANRSELARQLKDLAERPDYKFSAAMAIGSSALCVSDYAAAVEAAIDGLSAGLDQTEGLVKLNGAMARKDRVLLGLIDEAYRRSSPDARPAMDEFFQNRLKEARKSKDRFAIQQLAIQWRGLDWGRNLVVTEEDKALRKQSKAEIELRLFDAAGSQDKQIARRALERLGARFEKNRDYQEAWAINKRLHNEFLLNTSANANSDSVQKPPAPQEFNRNAKRPQSGWPLVFPTWESIEDRNFSVYSLIPVHAEPGSLLERMDVWIDRNSGNDVLFRGAAFFQSGQDENDDRKFTLPPSNSPYRNQLGYMLREGWGVGRIVILLVGSELFGISPLDDQGEPNSHFLLWSIELGPPPNNSKVLRGNPNINDGYEFLVDQSNRQIGKVGPVRPNYFCYQQGTRLVAAETETGKELWERFDLPATANLLGDDHNVYVWRENALEVLSAIDGRKIEDRTCSTSSTHLIHQFESLAWTASRNQDLQIELTDLKTGNTIWSRTEHKDSRAVPLDHDTIAVATPEGKLIMLEARTGHEMCQPLSVTSHTHPQILTWNDPDRWFVMLGSSVLNPGKAKPTLDAYRKSIVSGTLFCIDRFDPKILWQREIKDEQIALDQSKTAPVLVQLWKQGTTEQNNGQKMVLQVTDKLTGKQLAIKPKADLPTHFLLNPDQQLGIVELRLARETLRINYSPDSPADALEVIQKTEEKLPAK